MEQKIDIGTFTRKVSFCVVTSTKSAMGAASKSYAHSFYMYMDRVQEPSGLEQIINNRVVVPTRYTYKGHYKSTINETMQLVDGSEKFNILSVNPAERNMFIEVFVEKITE
jgi:head-tail adaptor